LNLRRVAASGARGRDRRGRGRDKGYQEFLEALLDSKHEEHAHMTRWCGGHFDPEWFDLELINTDVARALKPNVKRRLHQPRLIAN
jgi:hypothetical protein